MLKKVLSKQLFIKIKHLSKKYCNKKIKKKSLKKWYKKASQKYFIKKKFNQIFKR